MNEFVNDPKLTKEENAQERTRFEQGQELKKLHSEVLMSGGSERKAERKIGRKLKIPTFSQLLKEYHRQKNLQ